MRKSTSFSLFSKAAFTDAFSWAALLLRLGFGLLFFMAGWSKLTAEGGWSAAGYLSASTGPFAEWFQSMAGSVLVDQLNIWGLLLIGLAFLLGAFMRLASLLAIILMLLYYFSGFEMNTMHGLLNEHIMYSMVFLLFMTGGFGHIWGVDAFLKRQFRKSGGWTSWLFG